MRRYAMTLAAAFLSTAALPGVAAAADAVARVDLNMRAGPSTSFPVVEVIPDEGRVTVHGCVRGYQWCDVTWRGERGWVYASHLQQYYRERYVPLVEYAPAVGVPIIGFSIGTYWDNYYRDRSWYDRRSRWRNVWRDDRRDGRRNARGDRRDNREDRRADRREDRIDRRQDNRAERREERQERRADRSENREDRADRQRNRVERQGARSEGRQGVFERQRGGENRAERQADRQDRMPGARGSGSRALEGNRGPSRGPDGNRGGGGGGRGGREG